MHPAEHRGLRELYAVAQQLRRHWRELAGRLDGAGGGGAAAGVKQLRAGAESAGALLCELRAVTAARGLHGRPSAQGVGARIAAARLVLVDPTLEVGQALRLAVLDAQHVTTLLAHLARLAARRGDGELQAFLTKWEGRMRVHEGAVRATAIATGDDPDAAVAVATPGLAGRVGHGLAAAVGTAGEWIDGRLAR
jgi:hypothetical protein